MMHYILGTATLLSLFLLLGCGWRYNEDNISVTLHEEGKQLLEDEFELFAIKNRRDLMAWGVYGMACVSFILAALWAAIA